MRAAAALCVLAAGAALAACGGSEPAPQSSAGRGHAVIVHIGCGACHTIGGVEGADGRIGPSLKDFKSKRYIAGRLPNSPAQVRRWIRNPQAIRPGTIMPDLGLSDREVRDVVSYLYTQ